MTELEVPDSAPSHRPNRGWLLFFGILEILTAAGAALFGILTMVGFLFAESLPAAQSQPNGAAVLAYLACFYGGAALFFAAAGVGTLQRRRWARIMMLIGSSLWLAFGILATLVFLLLWPVVSGGISQQNPAVSGGVLTIALSIIVGTLLIFWILLPGSFLLFYTRKSVREAFERGDHGQDPTAHRPVLVLALCAWMVFGAVGALFSTFLNYQAVFGFLLTGWPAFVTTILLAGAQGALARGLYRLEPWAWWSTLAFKLLMGISGLMTLWVIPLPLMIERMGYDSARRGAMEPVMLRLQSLMPAIGLVGMLLILSLLLFVKRYFRGDRSFPDASATG